MFELKDYQSMYNKVRTSINHEVCQTTRFVNVNNVFPKFIFVNEFDNTQKVTITFDRDKSLAIVNDGRTFIEYLNTFHPITLFDLYKSVMEAKRVFDGEDDEYIVTY